MNVHLTSVNDPADGSRYLRPNLDSVIKLNLEDQKIYICRV